jgi:hypothetical protein
MLRPRWHDALIVSAIVGMLLVGVWALWWDDVRGLLHLAPTKSHENSPADTTPPSATGPAANSL